MPKASTIIVWILQIGIAGLFLMTLPYKFGASPDSVFIFSALGIEPWGRILTGVLELAAAVFLLMPKKPVLNASGAVLAIGLMAGAIMGHLTKLGISIPEIGYGPGLFIEAVLIFCAAIFIAYTRRKDIPYVGEKINF